MIVISNPSSRKDWGPETIHAGRLMGLFIALVLTIAACNPSDFELSSPQPSLEGTQPGPAITTTPAAVINSGNANPNAVPDLSIGLGYTHIQPDGNRFLSGRGNLPSVTPVDISLDGKPVWVVAAPTGEGTIWAVVLEDGAVQAFQAFGQEITPITIHPSRIFPGMPPHLRVVDNSPRILVNPSPDGSNITHPILSNPADNELLYIASNGDLVTWTSEQEGNRLATNSPPDARILNNGGGQLLLLSGATNSYDHGVLGDGIESEGFTIIDTTGDLNNRFTVNIPAPGVIEGIAPIWADLNGDGSREIIVTVSDPGHGARIQAYDSNGTFVSEGPPIGTGYRWRHQLAVAPFGPNGEIELAVIRTPHIGGILEFYRLGLQGLEIVGLLDGYSSHEIGSRNLDGALAGDLDGDGTIEILVSDQSRRSLAAVQHTDEGVKEIWELPLTARLSTNLAGVRSANERISAGVGLDNSTLRLWLSD